MFYLLLAKLIAVLDLVIKSGIEQIPYGNFPGVLKGTKGQISLHRTKNEGLPFGKFSNSVFLTKFVPLTILASCIFRLNYLVLRRKSHPTWKGNSLEKLALSFIVGGGISNVAERLKKGYVVDYFSLNTPRCKKLQNTIFNLGDVFIILGSLLTIFHSIGKEDK